MAKREQNPAEDELIRTRHRKKKTSGKRVSGRRAPDDPQARKRRDATKVRVKLDEPEPEVNRYYIAIADRYRWARYISFILLVGFLLTMLLFYRENITYSNLMYLVRDLDVGEFSTVGQYADLHYEKQYAVSFAMYRDRIAMGGSAGFRLYSASGAKEMEYTCAYSDPWMAVGNKYALMYDAGGTEYALYTTIARVFSASTDYQLEDAAVSDSGAYALLTRSEESKFLVTVYNADFKAQTKYYKDKYVLDIALDAEGKELAILSADVSGTGTGGEIMLCKVGSEDTATITITDAMPLFAEYTDDGHLIVLCDNRIQFYENGVLSATQEFVGMVPASFDLAENCFALCCAKNALGTENEIFVFDSSGNIIYNNIISEKIMQICADNDGTVYALGEEEVFQFRTDSSTPLRASVQGEVLDMLAAAGGLIILEDTQSYSLVFGE